MSRLITPSLIGSIDWYKHCPQSWKQKAATDLKNQLARDYSEPPGPALKLGIAFEDAVYACANTPESTGGTDHFKWFVEECKGAEFQRKTKSYMTIDKEEYCLYGKIDAWFPTIIKDIKTTSNYKGSRHYLASFQHKMYCWNEKIAAFRYIVAEFDSDQKIVDHHAIDYEVVNRDLLECEIVASIKEAIKFLESNTELFKLYTTKFSMY